LDPVLYIIYSIQNQKDADSMMKWINDTLKDSSENEIFIQKAVSSFIHGIEMSTRIPKKEGEKEKFNMYSPILKRLLVTDKSKKDAILQIQMFCKFHDFQDGLCLSLFELFLSEELIDSSIFKKWLQDSKFGAEFDKEKAVQQTKDFIGNL
jgi:hypothetical protein